MIQNKPVKNDMRTVSETPSPRKKLYENRRSENTEENDMSTEAPKTLQKKKTI